MRALFASAIFCLFGLVTPVQAQTGSTKTPAALTTETNTLWPDNTIGSITPFNARQTLLDIINSYAAITNSAVLGPGSSTSGHIAVWNNTTGTLLGDSGYSIGLNVGSALSNPLNGSGGLVGYSGALGTPVSANLSNATGLPISTGVSGLGTGVVAALGNPINGSGGTIGNIGGTSECLYQNNSSGVSACLASYINASAFGVTCNGTDETSKLQAAINAATGGKLILPAGTCNYSQFTSNSGNLFIEGQGRGLTVLQQNTTTGDGIRLGNFTFQTVTITIATPGVITLANHGFTANEPLKFATTGALPTGLSPNTLYYVVGSSITTNTFQVSTSSGGSAINTSGSQSGTQSVQPFTATYNYTLANLSIFPATNKSSGFALHARNIHQLYLFNVETGSDVLNATHGNWNYGGVWSDGASGTHLEQSEVWAQGDSWLIDDCTDCALHYTNLRFGSKNLHFAGGVQGFHCTQSNIESGVNNFYVDNSVDASNTNAAAFLGTACAFDTASSDNVVINTTLGGLVEYNFTGASIATQNGDAIKIISAPNFSRFTFANAVIGSYSGSGSGPTAGNGIELRDCSATVAVSAGTTIFANPGYGIYENSAGSGLPCSGVPNPIYVDTLSMNWAVAGIGNATGNTNFSASPCAPGFTYGASGCVWTQTASNSATLQWTGLVNNRYTLRCDGVQPVTDGGLFQAEVGTGAGPSWQSGNYAILSQFLNGGSNTPVVSNGGSYGQIELSSIQGITNNATFSASAILEFLNFNAASYHHIYVRAESAGTTGTTYFENANFESQTTTVLTAIKVYMSTGNIAAGTCSLYELVQ